ncbi:MAG: AraC family transcriptional regulator [Pseudomonadota bacterium]
MAIDALFRFSGVGLLTLLAILTWRDHRRWVSAPYLVLSCISVTALFLGYTLDPLRLPMAVHIPARFIDLPNLVFVWLFALSLFDDRFRLQPWHIFVGVAYTAPILWSRLADFEVVARPPLLFYIYGACSSLLLVGHLCVATLRGRADDLLTARRASRLYFVLLITAVTALAAISEILLPADGIFGPRTAKVLSIWPAIFWGCLWMLRFKPEAAAFQARPRSGRTLDQRDAALCQCLTDHMLAAAPFRDPALTISALSRQIGISETRLRKLINSQLGHRNFSAFINGYRIDAVKAAFADPNTSSLPILSIATDCGFNSLSVFNKAFRESEGMTPSAYRKRRR